MTREEATKWLKTFKGNTGMAELSQAFDVAIKALEQYPCDKYIKEIDHLRKYISKLETQIVEQDNADTCYGCAFEDVEAWEMPCSKCKRGCKDYWRPKKEN